MARILRKSFEHPEVTEILDLQNRGQMKLLFGKAFIDSCVNLPAKFGKNHEEIL